jgi:hypothetical protein
MGKKKNKNKSLMTPVFNIGSFLVKISADAISTSVVIADDTRKGLKKEFKHLKKVDNRSVGKNLSVKNGKRNSRKLRN